MTRRISALDRIRIEDELESGLKTYADLSAATGLSKPAVMRYVKMLREIGIVSIQGWRQDARGRPFVPEFSLMSPPDKPRPGQSRSPAERMAAYRAAKKNDRTGENHDPAN